MKAKLGIAPIAWWNDDLEELSDDVSLEECLRQASEAGYSGMETGRRFPMDPAILGPVLERYGISVCGGWFSGLLLSGEIEAEKDRVAAQLELFKAMGAPCIVYGETAGTIQGDHIPAHIFGMHMVDAGMVLVDHPQNISASKGHMPRVKKQWQGGAGMGHQKI